MKPYILILSFLIIPFFMYGQKDYQSGYVITNNNDTLFGMLKDRKLTPFGKIYKKIRFRDKGMFAKKMGPDQIKGYIIGDNQFESLWIDVSGRFFRVNYLSVPGSGGKQFLKVIVKGYLTYYKLEFVDQESVYFDEIPFYKRQNEPSLVRVTQGVFGLKKNRLSEYFHDCPDLVFKIKNEELKDPVDVADYYNLWKKNN